MVAAFLKAEVFSSRFGEEVRKAMQLFGAGEDNVVRPDITNEQQNALRAQVLGEYRGYRQNREMFEGVPDSLTWYEAEITREEVGNLRYVDYSYWNELTDGTHLVKDGVRNIRRGKIVYDVPHSRFWAIADNIGRGEYGFEPMILWGQDVGASLVVLEGHLRATAFALAGDKAPAVVKVIVGLVSAVPPPIRTSGSRPG